MSEKKRYLKPVLLLVAISIFLSVSDFSASAKTQEFNDKLLSGEGITIDDMTFTVTINKYANAIYITGSNLSQSVPLFKCESMKHFEVCFDNTTYDEEENDLYALIRIFRYRPDLSITRTANTTEFYVGKEAKVTLKITNTGDTASKVIMTDDYPLSIEISEMEGGCNVHENQVYWQGHLDEDKTKECIFLIKGTKELHQSFVAHLKYWDGFKWVDKYSPTMTLDINPVISIFSSLVNEEYEVDGTTFDFEKDPPGVNIGEVFRLLINITSEYDDDLDIDSFEINLPEDLEYASIGSLRFNFKNATGNRSSIVWSSDSISRITNRILRWKGSLDNKTSKLFILNIKAKGTGNQNVVLKTKYTYDRMTFEEMQHKSFDVIDPGIGIRMTVDDPSKRFSGPVRLDEEDDTIDIEALHPYKINIYTQNLNNFAVIRNVDIKIITEIAGFKPVYYSEIDEKGQRIPYSLVMIPPNVPTDKEFKTNVSIKYINEFGEKKENSTEFLLNVKPTKDLTITIDSSEGESLMGGEESVIKVSVTNDRIIDIKGVSVKDEICPLLHVEGVHAQKVKLNKESDTEVYSYRIKAPIVHHKTECNITTTVSFFDPDYRMDLNFSETSTITLEPLIPEIDVEATMDKPDEIYPGTLLPVEYTITNSEERELVRNITLHFPLQEDLDLVGPKTFFIDKLDPGEKQTIKNLVKLRPKKVMDGFKINQTIVEYSDDYGNVFYENSTEETIDVNDAMISGPSISLKTIAPAEMNKSTDTPVNIEITNSGDAATDLVIEQGNMMWNTSIPPQSTRSIQYNLRYDAMGNYTIPDPIAKLKVQGVDAYTKGTGAEVAVKFLEGAAPAVIAEDKQIAKEEIIQQEKEEMSFEEYEAQKGKAQEINIRKYSTLLGIAFIVGIVIIAYMFYQKRKPAAAPFMENEE